MQPVEDRGGVRAVDVRDPALVDLLVLAERVVDAQLVGEAGAEQRGPGERRLEIADHAVVHELEVVRVLQRRILDGARVRHLEPVATAGQRRGDGDGHGERGPARVAVDAGCHRSHRHPHQKLKFIARDQRRSIGTG